MNTLQLPVWVQCKIAALSGDDGLEAGLVKIAAQAWANAYGAGDGRVLTQDERTAFFASFASASHVDARLDKMASEGKLSAEDRALLGELTARSALNDLRLLTKDADAKVDMGLFRSPQAVIGAIAGAAITGALGAWTDKDKPARGAALNAVPGGLIGGLLGAGAASAMKMAAEERGFVALQALKSTALRTRNDKLAALLFAHTEDVVAHFGAGNHTLPDQLKTACEGNAELEALRAVREAFQKLADNVNQQMPGVPPPQGEQPPPGDAMPPPGDPSAVPPGMDPSGGGAAGEQLDPNAGQQMGDLQGQLSESLAKGQATVDNMAWLAQQVGLPQLAQDIQGNTQMLVDHFAQGNAYLPAALQHHFKASENAEQFMKKYTQRFGKPSAGAKTKPGM